MRTSAVRFSSSRAARCTALIRLGLVTLLLVLRVGTFAASVGPISVSWEYGQPVLTFSNMARQAFVIETTADPSASVWRVAATITGNGTTLAWADDSEPEQARFYRVGFSKDPAPFVSLQAALQRGCTNQGIVGASAAAMLPVSGLWLGTFGTLDGRKPIRPYTPFEIGSVTKTLVAATVLRLVDEGRLGLDDTLAQRLPNLSVPNISTEITVRQLLNHRAGTYNFGDDPDFRQQLFANWSRRWEPEDVLRYAKEPYFTPDSSAAYSNTGYVLLGMVIQSVTGSTVAVEMRRTVLEPAGMRSTWMGAEESWPRELAHPHLDFNGDGIHEDLGHRSQTAILTSFWTSGSEISTAADLVKFGNALSNGRLLSQSSLEAMTSFQPLEVLGTQLEYGLGLMRYDILGREHWAHSGGLFGEYAWFSHCPSTGVSLGVAYNYPITKTGPSLPGELLLSLAAMEEE